MGKISNITIVYNRDQETFQPGSSIAGEVKIQVHKAVRVTAIKIQVIGSCKTKWKTGSGDNEKTYKAKEQYCCFETILWGGVSGDQGTSIIAGAHKKQFVFQLPLTCPSSFQSKHGNVLYTSQVVCHYPGMMSSDQTITRPFLVYDLVDLSLDAQTAELLLRPLQLQDQASDECCCCCDKVSVKVDITLDKCAYAPGDHITLNGYIDNGCDSEMPYSIVLKQYIACYARRSDFSFTSSGNLKSKEKTVEVVKWLGQPIPRRSRKVFQNEQSLQIPNVVSSQLRNCSLINVSYYIKIKGVFPGFCEAAFELKKVNIMIGGRSGTMESVLTPSAPPNDLPLYNTLAPTTTSSILPLDIVDVKIEGTEPPPPTYDESVMLQPPSDPLSTQAPATQTTYYDWSQSAFSYN